MQPNHKTKTYTIELSVKIDAGYEPTIPHQYRPARFGEHFVSTAAGDVEVCKTYQGTSLHYLIVRPRFDLPRWIPAGWWIAKDRCGQVHLFDRKPMLGADAWTATGGVCHAITQLLAADFVTLPELEWRESIWQQKDT